MEITIQVTRTKLLNYQSAGLLFSRRIDSNNEGARRLSSVWRTAYENHLFCLWWRTHFAIAGITILVGDQLPPEVSSCRVGQRIVAKIVPPFHFVSSLLCVCVWLASEWSGAKASESVGPSERERRRRKRRMEKERERERERDPRHKVDNICWPVHRIAGSCNRSDASLATDLENEEQLWTPRLLIGFGSRRSLVPLYPRNIPRDGLRLFWTACMTCFGSHHRILVSTISRVHCISFILIKKMKQKS